MRESGYYWIVAEEGGDWEIAEWNQPENPKHEPYWIRGWVDDEYNDKIYMEVYVVDERRITRQEK